MNAIIRSFTVPITTKLSSRYQQAMKYQNRLLPIIILSFLTTILTTAAIPICTVEANPKKAAEDAVKYFNDGNDLFDRGDFEEAIRMFNVASMLMPDLPGPYRRLGQAYLKLNNCNDAVNAFNKYLDLQPDGKFASQAHEEIKNCRAKLSPSRPTPGTRVPSTGYLNLTCSIPEATMAIDGKPMGTLPVSRLELPVGSHKVTVHKPGYKVWEATVEITPGKPTNRMANLQRDPNAYGNTGSLGGRPGPVIGRSEIPQSRGQQFPAQPPKQGRLYLQITPPGATVKVDNVTIGKAPLDKIELAKGNHIVRVEKAKYKSQELQISVIAGKDTHASFTLQPIMSDQTRSGGSTTSRDPVVNRPPPASSDQVGSNHKPGTELPGSGNVNRPGQGRGGQVEEPLFADNSELERRNRALRTAGWTALALGTGAVAGGVYCGLQALEKEENYHAASFTSDRQSIKRSGERFATATDVLLIGGGTLITTGVVLLIMGRTPSNPLDALDMYSGDRSRGNGSLQAMAFSPFFTPLTGGGAMGLATSF